MTDKYRIDPDFVVPEPTPADMFNYCPIEEISDEFRRRAEASFKQSGCRQARVTLVNDEFPNPPYPHGYWFEGWRDPNARMLPFGEGGSPHLCAVEGSDNG